MSAIWVEQPPSASAVASSVATDRSLIVRSTGIRPGNPQLPDAAHTYRDGIYALVRALQRKIVPRR
jgi:hypothetical protein